MNIKKNIKFQIGQLLIYLDIFLSIFTFIFFFFFLENLSKLEFYLFLTFLILIFFINFFKFYFYLKIYDEEFYDRKLYSWFLLMGFLFSFLSMIGSILILNSIGDFQKKHKNKLEYLNPNEKEILMLEIGQKLTIIVAIFWCFTLIGMIWGIPMIKNCRSILKREKSVNKIHIILNILFFGIIGGVLTLLYVKENQKNNYNN